MTPKEREYNSAIKEEIKKKYEIEFFKNQSMMLSNATRFVNERSGKAWEEQEKLNGHEQKNKQIVTERAPVHQESNVDNLIQPPPNNDQDLNDKAEQIETHTSQDSNNKLQ